MIGGTPTPDEVSPANQANATNHPRRFATTVGSSVLFPVIWYDVKDWSAPVLWVAATGLVTYGMVLAVSRWRIRWPPLTLTSVVVIVGLSAAADLAQRAGHDPSVGIVWASAIVASTALAALPWLLPRHGDLDLDHE